MQVNIGINLSRDHDSANFQNKMYIPTKLRGLPRKRVENV